jgi:(2Fe-2S) ferredoxin
MPEVYVPLEGLVVSELTGSYTFRMYGFLKDHLKRGKIELSKEELFNFFSLPKSYENKTNLVKKFIKPTLEEVEKVSGIHTNYEFIPKNRYTKIQFYPVLKNEVKAEELKVMPKENINQSIENNFKILEEIKKAKKNIYVSRAWNKRAENKISKLLREEGEEYAIFILKTLYRSLKDDIKTTLVQYINGVIKNQPKNEVVEEILKSDIIEVEIVEEKTEQLKEDPLAKVLLNWYDKMPKEEKDEIKEEAIKKYLQATNTENFTKVHQKIFKSNEKIYIIEVMKQIQGV